MFKRVFYKMSNAISKSKQSGVGAQRKVISEEGASSSDSSVYKSSAEDPMPSKGAQGSSLYSSSDEYFGCDPCSSVGDHAEAHGYCTNCEEYLCVTCFRSHSRSKATKTHVLLIKDTMPKKSHVSLKQCDSCKTVGEDKEFVGYCTDCKEYLCSSCFKSHSKSKSSREHMLIDKDSLSAEDFDQAVTDSLAALGIDTIDTGACTEEYILIRDINVKTGTDEKDCYITGMTMISNTKLVLCDINNVCLKLVDIESSTIQDSMVLHAEPFGIATISLDKVAVVIANKYQIQTISIRGGLSVDNTIRTNGNCVEVKFSNGKFYVAFIGPVKFQILQPTGAIIKTIKPDSEVMKYFTSPHHIAISPDDSVIFVSDFTTNNVLSMDMDGNMIAMYEGDLESPHYITVAPRGTVYLCNRKQNVMYRMTSDLTEATVILGPGDGLYFPHAMCLNMDKQELYISNGSSEAKHANCIKVFQLK